MIITILILYSVTLQSKFEAYVTEINLCLSEIDDMLAKLKEYMQPEVVSLYDLIFFQSSSFSPDFIPQFVIDLQREKALVTFFDKVQIRSDPLGVVLVISAWNYPVNLTIAPLVGIIAAGNCAVIKPSEIALKSAQAMKLLLSEYLDAVSRCKIHLCTTS